MPKGLPRTGKWISILADIYGPTVYQHRLYELEPPAFTVWVQSIGYMTKQGINHVPQAIPRLAVGPRAAKRAVNQLVEAGLFIPDVDNFHSYGIAHEGVLWRRGRVPDVRASIPDAVRAKVYERDGFACVQCQATEWLSLDHIWPYSKGGTDNIENLRVLCRVCNSRKGNRVHGA